MTEVVLAVLLVGAVLWHVWSEAQHTAERRRLINTILARTPTELAAFERASTTTTRPPVERDRPAVQVGI